MPYVLLQTQLAERTLRALGRTGEHRRLARALRGEVGQRLQAVLVGRRLGDRERVLCRRRSTACRTPGSPCAPSAVSRGIVWSMSLVGGAASLAVLLGVQEVSERRRVLGHDLDLVLLELRQVELAVADRLDGRRVAGSSPGRSCRAWRVSSFSLKSAAPIFDLATRALGQALLQVVLLHEGLLPPRPASVRRSRPACSSRSACACPGGRDGVQRGDAAAGLFDRLVDRRHDVVRLLAGACRRSARRGPSRRLRHSPPRLAALGCAVPDEPALPHAAAKPATRRTTCREREKSHERYA